MRKTKIICTIGPSSENKETLVKMCKAGMNVARLNFSHGKHEEHIKKMNLIKEVREELQLPIAIMLDTKGPEYRIGTFENGSIELNEGDTFTFTSKDIVGNKGIVSVSYKNFAKELNVGDTILVNNGISIFEIVEKDDEQCICKVLAGGTLSNRKSMSFPQHVMKQEFLSEQDKKDLLFGIENDVDFVAASFVSNKEDVSKMRTFLDENGGKDIEIIAKIENLSGVENVDSICEIAHGIMVARGDLGVEIPFVKVPTVQKFLIERCQHLGKRVITATEMLESMIYNPRPTRAEISDVANAVYDGSSAIMLSGETASGQHPVEAVKTMSDIAMYTEEHIDYESKFRSAVYSMANKVDALSHATCAIAFDSNAKAIVINSFSGITVKIVSRFKPQADILGTTINEKVYRQLNLCWGVKPLLTEEYNSMDVIFYESLKDAKRNFDLKPGDTIVVTGGQTNGKTGNSNTIRLETI